MFCTYTKKNADIFIKKHIKNWVRWVLLTTLNHIIIVDYAFFDTKTLCIKRWYTTVDNQTLITHTNEIINNTTSELELIYIKKPSQNITSPCFCLLLLIRDILVSPHIFKNTRSVYTLKKSWNINQFHAIYRIRIMFQDDTITERVSNKWKWTMTDNTK